MFNLQEAAIAYAKGAERILGDSSDFINENQELVPVFVASLFQSVEITLKHLGIEAGLFTESESRDKKLTRNGHGIREIAELANKRLGTNHDYPVIMALTDGMNDDYTTDFLHKMIFSPDFYTTRKAYQSRNLGYAQIQQGELKLFYDLPRWVNSVKKVAENLPTAIRIVTEWKNSGTNSNHFAIWYK